MESLVRISEDKYKATGKTDTYFDVNANYLFHILKPFF